MNANRKRLVVSARGIWRKRSHISILAALPMLVLAGLTDGWAAEATGPTCIVLERQGKVEVSPKGRTEWRLVQTNDVLQVGDRLRTGLRSRATLRWSELSVVRVDELTSMEIQPPEQAGGKAELELRSGASYFFSRERPDEIRFRTPVASGAIRGTEFNLAVPSDGRMELALLDGQVYLASVEGNTTLNSGELGTVEQGKAPMKTPLINAINVIQWVLYYPAVVDANEVGLSDSEKRALEASLKAYAHGDLRGALESYPEGRVATSEAEKLFLAALQLAAGGVSDTEAALKEVSTDSPIANALREVIAAVKHQELPSLGTPSTASEFMARSYYLQSRASLSEALAAARDATTHAPEFGAAWVRLAELEFGFGRTDAAERALDKGLELSPKNAQGHALNGFILSAQYRSAEALASFDRAIALDGALANAWLGRGLLKIRTNDEVLRFLPNRYQAGLDDLQVAATLEPQRAVLRSYLGKAFADAHDLGRARKELDLARRLDPSDPTSWLYSALLNQQDNRVNEAVADLEKSKELNENRSLFRSRLLLDQDQAVRGANLAGIYRDAGMFDRSVQEASRAVESDYANSGAHLFLSSSYDSLRDPKLINLRYETAWFSELLLANLLAPVGAGNLSQNVSQQEYSRFFDSDGLGFFSSTEYRSSGDWIQSASQYGHFGRTDYSVDAYYRTENGSRPNNDLEQLNLTARLKQQITDQDSLFFQINYFDAESGDLAQYYNDASSTNFPGTPTPSTTLRVEETQEPNVVIGYHREWAPGNHTLALFSRFDDTLKLRDSNPGLLWLRTSSFLPPPTNIVFNPAFFSRDYESELEAYSAELQQIWQRDPITLIVGGRYQTGDADTTDDLNRVPPVGAPTQILTTTSTDLNRYSAYGYAQWRALDSLKLIGGVSYDRLEYPVNIDTSPVTSREDSKDQVSPKAGVIWSPLADTQVRGVYTRSLGGVFFDNSIRLEPSTIAGFNQAYRSMIPESVAGLVPGTEFETFGVGVDQAFKTGTYLYLQGERLESEGARTVGILANSDPLIPVPDSASSTRQSLDYEENSLVAAINQLVSDELALGARYRFTEADLRTRSLDIAPTVPGAGALNQDVSAHLHQVQLYAIYQVQCGFFAQFDGIWSSQSNQGYTPALPGDSFWQFNAYAGYRFLERRAELRFGLLNLTDENYRLNPLTLYNELPRGRTFTVSLQLDF